MEWQKTLISKRDKNWAQNELRPTELSVPANFTQTKYRPKTLIKWRSTFLPCFSEKEKCWKRWALVIYSREWRKDKSSLLDFYLGLSTFLSIFELEEKTTKNGLNVKITFVIWKSWNSNVIFLHKKQPHIRLLTR